MVLYLKLDQKQWAIEDFTDDATYDLSGTIYRDPELTVAETNLGNFTGTFRLIKAENGSLIYENDQDLTLNTDGTFVFRPIEGRAPLFRGSTRVRIKLEKSGSRLTGVGVNGSDELFLEHK